MILVLDFIVILGIWKFRIWNSTWHCILSLLRHWSLFWSLLFSLLLSSTTSWMYSHSNYSSSNLRSYPRRRQMQNHMILEGVPTNTHGLYHPLRPDFSQSFKMVADFWFLPLSVLLLQYQLDFKDNIHMNEWFILRKSPNVVLWIIIVRCHLIQGFHGCLRTHMDWAFHLLHHMGPIPRHLWILLYVRNLLWLHLMDIIIVKQYPTMLVYCLLLKFLIQYH